MVRRTSCNHSNICLEILGNVMKKYGISARPLNCKGIQSVTGKAIVSNGRCFIRRQSPIDFICFLTVDGLLHFRINLEDAVL
jgi:hypothetical protein